MSAVVDLPRNVGFWHGAILGPIGLILLPLYKIANSGGSANISQTDPESIKLLSGIANDLGWLRQQKEKELHRAKAAQSRAADL